MIDQHMNSYYWRQQFPIDRARFQLIIGDWIANLESNPVPQPKFVGFDIAFSLVGDETRKKRMELVVPMGVLIGEPDQNLNVFRHEIEEFLNSDKEFLSSWHQG